MSRLPRVSLVQMTSCAEVGKNLDTIRTLIRRAADTDPAAIFLPENFAALGSADPRRIGVCEADAAGEVRGLVSSLAAETGCWIFAGTLPTVARPDGSLVRDGRVRAASFVYDGKGMEVARYDKMHLFDVDVQDGQGNYRESATFEPGEEVVTVDSPIGQVGLTVCYDVRFPEIYRRLAAAGAIAMAIPCAFTLPTGRAHFELLLRARAVENSVFTIAACQGGRHDTGRETYGHSMVVDPWGEVVGQVEKGRELLTVSLDLDRQREIRQEMPWLRQRKLV